MTLISFSTYSRLRTNIWLHYLDINETPRWKARWEQHNEAVCCFEQKLKTAFYKAAAERQLTSHLVNYPTKTSKAFWLLLVKQKRTQRHISFDWPAKNWIHQPVFCWPWISSWGRTRSDGRSWWITRETQRNPCSQHALMMMILVVVSLFGDWGSCFISLSPNISGWWPIPYWKSQDYLVVRKVFLYSKY